MHYRTIENVERMWTWPDFVTLTVLCARFGFDPFDDIDSETTRLPTAFEQALQEQGLPDGLVVEVRFVLQHRAKLRQFMEDAPHLTDKQTQTMLEAAGSHAMVAVEPDGAVLTVQEDGSRQLETALASAARLVRHTFDDAVVLAAGVRADINADVLDAVVRREDERQQREKEARVRARAASTD